MGSANNTPLAPDIAGRLGELAPFVEESLATGTSLKVLGVDEIRIRVPGRAPLHEEWPKDLIRTMASKRSFLKVEAGEGETVVVLTPDQLSYLVTTEGLVKAFEASPFTVASVKSHKIGAAHAARVAQSQIDGLVLEGRDE